MPRVLLTGWFHPSTTYLSFTSNLRNPGGSGFIAAHVLDILLEHGHSVVTTVRSEAKAQTIRDAHPKVPKEKLDFAIVEDIAVEGAFDRAVKSEPSFEKVIHCASPFHFNVTDEKKDLYVISILQVPGARSDFRFMPVVNAIHRLMCIVCCHFSGNLLLKSHSPPQIRSCHHWHDWALESDQEERTDGQTRSHNQQLCSYHRCRQGNQSWSYVGYIT